LGGQCSAAVPAAFAGKMPALRAIRLSRYRSGPYFFEDDVGSVGLLEVDEEVSAGFLDSVADDPSDFWLPPLDDFRA